MSDEKASPVRATELADQRMTKGYGAARLEEKSRVMAVWNRGAAVSAGAARSGSAGRSPGIAPAAGPGWPER